MSARSALRVAVDVLRLAWIILFMMSPALLIAILAHVPVIREVMGWFLNWGAGA